MPSMALRGGTVVLVVLLVLPARAGSDLPVRRALQAASVVVETTGCAGVVAENPQIIVTAKHCVKGRTLRVRLSTGSEHTAWVVAVND
ncbi:MAG TPA: trypsin-like serine protease, partial [Candidatus Elarobacter sp.]|nr:trypsin-like serine protease [Candidatus Elarobacter sp.]